MQTNKTFSIPEALKFGWETFKKKPFFWIVAGLLSGIGMSGGGSGSPSKSSTNIYEDTLSQVNPLVILFVVLLIIAVGLAIGFVFLALRMGSYKAALAALDGKELKWSILVSEFKLERIFKFFLINIWYGIIVVLGFVAFIVPGIYFAIKYQYAGYFYVERNVGFSESFKLSAEATKGVKLMLMGFWITSFILIFLGILAFLIGLLVVIPVIYIANFYIYRKLNTQSGLSTPVVPAPTQPAVVYETPVTPAMPITASV